jgi:hypothetical protein
MLYWIFLFLGIYILPQLYVFILYYQAKIELKTAIQKSLWFSWILFLPILIILFYVKILQYHNISLNNMGNFFLHFVGGGFTCAIIFEYLNINSNHKFGFWKQLFWLYFVTSGLGVANELFEFFLDTFVGTRLSFDRIDTWRDLLANTLGAFFGFLLIKAIRKIYSFLVNLK